MPRSITIAATPDSRSDRLSRYNDKTATNDHRADDEVGDAKERDAAQGGDEHHVVRKAYAIADQWWMQEIVVQADGEHEDDQDRTFQVLVG